MSRIFTISPAKPFLNTLARGLLSTHTTPHELATVRVFLPTRRAVRSLERILLAESNTPALLLPKLEPLGELDENEGFFHATPSAFDTNPLTPTPTTITDDNQEAEAAITRRLLFARLIDQLLTHTQPQNQDPESRATQALGLADALERLLEEAESHGISAEDLVPKLDGIVPHNLTEHWQQNRKFLSILNQVLPSLEQENDLVVLARRHKLHVQTLIQSWQNNPPTHPIYVAGSTGSVHATTQLIKHIASLNNGTILLPGLDTHAHPQEWEKISTDPLHPQFALAQLLAALNTPYNQVQEWQPDTPPTEENPPENVSPQEARITLIRRALAPAEIGFSTLSHTPQQRVQLRHGLKGLQLLECETEQQEARAIALTLRSTLNAPQQDSQQKPQQDPQHATTQRILSPARLRALLITPSHKLARQVAGQLRAWNIHIDSASGIPLARTPSGTFLLLVLEACEAEWSPVLLLSVLKHPLVTFGLDRKDLLPLIRKLENAYLRRASAPRTLDELIQFLRAQEVKNKKQNPQDLSALLSCLDALRTAQNPLAKLLTPKKGETHAIADAWQAHRHLLSVLCGTSDPHQLFPATPFSEERVSLLELPALQRTLNALDRALQKNCSAELPSSWYGTILRAVLSERSHNPPFGDTRIAILSPMEARLLSADTVILAGLNESTWPKFAESGPWVGRAMRHQLELPSPEEQIGRTAHDFVQAFGAKQLLLTRSNLQDNQQQTASRWILRLQAMAHYLQSDTEGEEEDSAPDCSLYFDPNLPVRSWLAAEEQKNTELSRQVAQKIRTTPPPPQTTRTDWPRGVSVTQVGLLHRNPYEFFAKKILGLRELNPLEPGYSAASWGSYLHKLAEKLSHPENQIWQLLHQGDINAARQELGKFADQIAQDEFRQDANEFALRRGRALAALEWFLKRHHTALEAGAQVSTEVELERPYDGDLFLSGWADRIEEIADDTGKSALVRIIDLKSGAAPSSKAVKDKNELQLPLLAALFQKECAEKDSKQAEIIGEYWQLKGSFATSGVRKEEIDLTQLASEVWDDTTSLLTKAAGGKQSWEWGQDAPAGQDGTAWDFVWQHLARRL